MAKPPLCTGVNAVSMTADFSALSRRHRWLAFGCFCASFLLLALGVWHLDRQQTDAHRARVTVLAGDTAQAVQSRMSRLMSATYLLSAYVRANQGRVEQFDELGTQMLPFYPGATALGLAPDGVIRYVVPWEANQASIGFNQLADPAQSPEAFLAKETGRLTLAGPLNLVQGGLGVVGRLPIFMPNGQGQSPTFWGFAYVTVRFPDAFEGIAMERLSELGYRYRLQRRHPDTGMVQVIAESSDLQPGALMSQPVERTVLVPNGEWTLQVEPVNGWGRPGVLAFQLALAGIFSLLLGFLIRLYLARGMQKNWLEAQVRQRTDEIAQARDDLQATLNAVPDLLFEIDADGVLHGLHRHQSTLTVYGTEQLNGKNIAEFLPEHVVTVIRQAMEVAARDGRSGGAEYALDSSVGRQWFELSMAAKRQDSEGSVTGAPNRFIALSRNITTRKEADLKFQLATQFFEGSNEGLLITDADQRIIQINPAFTTITGYTPDEVMGQKPEILASGRHDASFYEAMWQEINAHDHWQGEVWNRRRNGEEYPEWLSISRIQDSQGLTTHYVAIFSDISRRLEQEARIRDLAYFDTLTGLANRVLLRDRVQHDLSMARRHQTALSLLFIDLDHFKHINDSLGHQVGDQLLIQVAQRIKHMLREQDTVARLGGDEFMVVLPETTTEGASHKASQLLQTLSRPYEIGGQELTVTPSIGIAMYPEDGQDFEGLYRCADTAMYRAKQEGRSRHAFFTREMQASAVRRLQLENALRRAIDRGEFSLHYQPQLTLDHSRVVGFEALLRWQHPELGAVSPGEFIPVAEQTGQIVAIGQWVLHTACQQMRQWHLQGLPDVGVAVNMSAVQFRQPDLVAQVARVLESTRLPAHCLELELTESTAMLDPEAAVTTMQALHRLGVRLSIDDFGTGYSSLSYLKRFQIHKLKIDQSFVRDLPDDPDDAGIVETIIQMARSLGLTTIAEGVETEAQHAFLQQRGCNEVQGYLLARPLPATALESWWRERLSPVA